MNKYLVTGGAGFIGSSLIRNLMGKEQCDVLNIDKLTYAGNLDNLKSVESKSGYKFHQMDIVDKESLDKIIIDFEPDYIMHLAAESHVDRSIDDPSTFISTNIIGTYNLLESVRNYLGTIPIRKAEKFRFHHISTDEVFGSLGSEGFFTEETKYDPSSPYSSSKASSDHLVRAWNRTYDLPIVITNCSNNYGPYQFPEKLIPLMIINALDGKPLPIYGNGLQVRDWLYVDDHTDALIEVVLNGKIGETYNIGGRCEKTNIELVQLICEILSQELIKKGSNKRDLKDQITFVDDRPGHDQRYAIDSSKISNELGWKPKESIESGLEKTINWYLENESWYQKIINQSYDGHRLGLKGAEK